MSDFVTRYNEDGSSEAVEVPCAHLWDNMGNKRTCLKCRATAEVLEEFGEEETLPDGSKLGKGKLVRVTPAAPHE